MLFDIRPKKRKEDLFGREEELNRLIDSKEPLVLVYGIRRIGKTSLLNVYCNEVKNCIFIDARIISSYADLVDELTKGARHLFDEVKIKTPLLEITKKGKKIEKVKQILEVLDEKETTLVIDEAQELRYLKDIKKILAWSYDNLDNVKIVLSGSEVGVLEEFVGVSDYSSPLYGRIVNELRLEKFDLARSLEFLKRGFAEHGLEVSRDECVEAHETFGGIVGWLTYYGYLRSEEKLDHGEAIAKVKEMARGLVSDELSKFLSMRKTAVRRYCCILKAIALGLKRWSDIKRYCNESNDRRLADALKRLEKYSFIGKGNGYYLLDPLMKEAILELCERPSI